MNTLWSSSPRDVAAEVLSELKASGWAPLTARPWNMHQPEETLWWIVPSTDLPAYKHGKLFIDPDRTHQANQLFCGLNVEKGVGEAASNMFTSAAGQRMIMRPDWIWHSFLSDLGDGRANAAAATAKGRLSETVTLRLEAAHASDPSFRPEGDHLRDVLAFSLGNPLTLERNHTPLNILTPLIGSTDTKDLARRIGAIPQLDWVWIDVYLGSVFDGTNETTDDKHWGPEQLGNLFLSWISWLR